MAALVRYTRLLIVGLIVAFFDAFGIGANDVANSFNTAVASGCISYKQAILIALFTEFLGAVLLGQATSEKILKIYTKDMWNEQGHVVMLMMCCALIGSSTWTISATKLGWPVSTSQAIIGGLLGVGVVQLHKAINLTMVRDIIISWFTAPLVAGTIAATIFICSKYSVLVHRNSFKRGLIAIPIYFAVTFGLNAVYIVDKNKIYIGVEGSLDELPLIDKIVFTAIILAITISSACFGWFAFVPWIKRKVRGEKIRWFHIFYSRWVKTQPMKGDLEEKNVTVFDKFKTTKSIDDKPNTIKYINQKQDGSWLAMKVREFFRVRFSKEVNKVTTVKDSAIHESVTKFDDDTEYLYGFLQVVSACMASFAHGSNDVANSLAPLIKILTIFFMMKEPDMIMKLSTKVYCAIAIDIGLILMGYKVMRTLGTKITFISPSRGFSIELGTCLTVLTCSYLGYPVSTTHCITGATAAVGLCNGSVRSLNWKTIGFCLISCFITLPCAGLTSGIVFYAIRNFAAIFDPTFNQYCGVGFCWSY